MYIYIGSIIPIFGFVNAGVSVRRTFCENHQKRENAGSVAFDQRGQVANHVVVVRQSHTGVPPSGDSLRSQSPKHSEN